MAYTTLISPAELAPQLDHPDWVVFDCRFVLDDPHAGRQQYAQGHIPGALYADLEADLSGTVIPGITGRHPLPPADAFVHKLSQWGVDSSVQVVAYDDWYGAFAARLWWMLRWLGHEAVAVLDGGVRGWQAAGYALRPGAEQRAPRSFTPRIAAHLHVTTADMLSLHTDPAQRVVDARSADRYRGEYEPRDPRAGHIPGAVNRFFGDNVDADERWLPAAVLREQWQAVIGDTPAAQVIHYCGSGVSGAQNALAMAHAGLGMGRVYIGSWSEWCADATRPIATATEPA